MPDVGSCDHASGILFAISDPVHTGGMQKMEIKRIMSQSEEKLLEQKLTSLFTLREKAEDYRDEYRYVRTRTEELRTETHITFHSQGKSRGLQR